MMDTNELKAFLYVAKFQSFSIAAEELFLTQPAVSKRISALESKLDAKLFDRIGHQISLTEHGKILVPKAEKIILEIEDTRRSIKNISGNISGNLSIGASHHVGLHRLPPYLKSYSQKHPEVNLDISFVDSEQGHDAVLKGEIEIAAVTLPNSIDPLLKSIPIWKDELNIVVAKDHPLAKEKKPNLKSIAEHQAILPSRATFTRGIIESTFAQEKYKIQTSIETNYIETIKMLVSIGLGWSALPQTMMTKELKVIPLKGFPAIRQLGCLYHRERTLSNAAQAMLNQLQEKTT